MLGGSITVGHGPRDGQNAWVTRIESWINTTFPHPDHIFLNKAVPAVRLCIASLTPQIDAEPDAKEIKIQGGLLLHTPACISIQIGAGFNAMYPQVIAISRALYANSSRGLLMCCLARAGDFSIYSALCAESGSRGY